MTTRTRRRHDRADQVARAQLAAKRARAMSRRDRERLRRVLDEFQARPTTGQFVQCWAVGRGAASVVQALDDRGQVWERVVDLFAGESGRKEIRGAWWIKLDMTRRDQ